MPRLPETTRWRDLSGGNIMKVSSDIRIPNAVPFSVNLLYDQVLGEAVSREGTSQLSQPEASQTATGLFQHLDTTHVNSIVFAGFNGSIYNGVSGASLIGSLTAANKMRFATFMNTTLMLNGAQSRAYSGGAWVSTGGALAPDGVPSGGQFPIEFKDRMYAAVTDRLYYTTIPSSGAVSWSASGSGSIQVEQEDGGGSIAGLNKVPGYLMIYKQRSLKRWNFDSSFPEDLINIGTQSNESILRARGKNFFFYGPNGFYETSGGFPKDISRPIQRIIDAIPSTFYENVNGWSDNDNLYWSVGDLTINFDRGFTETHNNVVVRYTLDTEQWCVLKYAHEFRFMHQYVDSNNAVLLIGADTTGRVLQINTGSSDNGTAITYILQSPEFHFGFRERLKTISEKVIVHSDTTHGSTLQLRMDYGEWRSVGSLKDIVSEVQISSFTAHIFEWRVSDSISGAQVKLLGMDFPTVDVHESMN